MPTKRTKATDRFENLLAKVPKGSKYVQVKTELGKLKYLPLEDLTDKDVIQVNGKGIPVTMKGSPGRPKAVVMEPQNRMVAEQIRLKAEAIEADPVLKAAREKPEDPDVLHQLVLALGQEAASIGFERTRAEQAGEKTSEISVRRIGALKAIADTWLKRKDQVTARGIDMASPAYKVLMTYVLATFKEAMSDSGLRPEMVDTVFARLVRLMGDEWEVEAKNRMKTLI